jgi:hypothetical protein
VSSESPWEALREISLPTCEARYTVADAGFDRPFDLPRPARLEPQPYG